MRIASGEHDRLVPVASMPQTEAACFGVYNRPKFGRCRLARLSRLTQTPADSALANQQRGRSALAADSSLDVECEMEKKKEMEKEMQMVKIDVSTTLAEAVNAFPHLAHEFERRSLDYCCGGARTLGEACALLGVDPQVTVVELSALAATSGSGSGSAEWTTMAADVLVDHLEATHHRYLWSEMPRVTALVDKIVSVHGDRHPELVEVASCFGQVRSDLEPHMLKEERMLFPMIRDLATSTGMPSFPCGSLQNPISVMLSEHDAVGDLLTRLRGLTDGYTPPTDGCASYAACFAAMAELEADTHLHIHKENNVLFPMVVRLEAERAAMK